jgi:acetyl-CoA synthetase
MSSIAGDETYEEAVSRFSWKRVWELFDGNEERLNIAHECIDRHRGKGVALNIKFYDGHTESYSFDELSDATGQFANWLGRQGIQKGDRVSVVVDPSKGFYVGMFGAMKYGAIAVPLFTLFGPEGLALRINDCDPKIILTQVDPAAMQAQFPQARVVRVDDAFWAELAKESTAFEPATRASDPALFQYTSGTTRLMPAPVKHSHRAVVTLMVAALYGLGIRPGDKYFCPSSPAWGHGLSHGTLSPLALGVTTGAYSGKFDPQRIFEALEQFQINNMAAAPTVFRMMRNSGLRDNYKIDLKKISFAGEPLDNATADWIEEAFGTPAASMYGSTEVGVVIANFPGMKGFKMKKGGLGKPVPGSTVAILDPEGKELGRNQSGEIAVKRKDGWFFVKDRGYVDDEGFFVIEGRSDDVIISAGWTMSAVEIENTLLKHPQVLEAAVVGAPDELRGLVAKAYIVARDQSDETAEAIKTFMKENLSAHEYPRQIEFVAELPKTPAGKVDRKNLRDRAKAQAAAAQ